LKGLFSCGGGGGGNAPWPICNGAGTNSADRLTLRSGIAGELLPSATEGATDGVIEGTGSRGGIIRLPGVSKLLRRDVGVIGDGSPDGGSNWD
jgi:hypothetical protein